jgi:hypothetical protein
MMNTFDQSSKGTPINYYPLTRKRGQKFYKELIHSLSGRIRFGDNMAKYTFQPG